MEDIQMADVIDPMQNIDAMDGVEFHDDVDMMDWQATPPAAEVNTFGVPAVIGRRRSRDEFELPDIPGSWKDDYDEQDYYHEDEVYFGGPPTPRLIKCAKRAMGNAKKRCVEIASSAYHKSVSTYQAIQNVRQRQRERARRPVIARHANRLPLRKSASAVPHEPADDAGADIPTFPFTFTPFPAPVLEPTPKSCASPVSSSSSSSSSLSSSLSSSSSIARFTGRGVVPIKVQLDSPSIQLSDELQGFANKISNPYIDVMSQRPHLPPSSYGNQTKFSQPVPSVDSPTNVTSPDNMVSSTPQTPVPSCNASTSLSQDEGDSTFLSSNCPFSMSPAKRSSQEAGNSTILSSNCPFSMSTSGSSQRAGDSTILSSNCPFSMSPAKRSPQEAGNSTVLSSNCPFSMSTSGSSQRAGDGTILSSNCPFSMSDSTTNAPPSPDAVQGWSSDVSAFDDPFVEPPLNTDSITHAIHNGTFHRRNMSATPTVSHDRSSVQPITPASPKHAPATSTESLNKAGFASNLSSASSKESTTPFGSPPKSAYWANHSSVVGNTPSDGNGSSISATSSKPQHDSKTPAGSPPKASRRISTKVSTILPRTPSNVGRFNSSNASMTPIGSPPKPACMNSCSGTELSTAPESTRFENNPISTTDHSDAHETPDSCESTQSLLTPDPRTGSSSTQLSSSRTEHVATTGSQHGNTDTSSTFPSSSHEELHRLRQPSSNSQGSNFAPFSHESSDSGSFAEDEHVAGPTTCSSGPTIVVSDTTNNQHDTNTPNAGMTSLINNFRQLPFNFTSPFRPADTPPATTARNETTTTTTTSAPSLEPVTPARHESSAYDDAGEPLWHSEHGANSYRDDTSCTLRRATRASARLAAQIEEKRARERKRNLELAKITTLTEEWEGRVQKGLKVGHPPEYKASDFARVVSHLQGGGHDDWLNDETVNGYLKLATKFHNRDHPSTVPKSHAFPSFMLNKIAESGWEGVSRWAKRAKVGGKDLLQVDTIFFPVNSGNHWTLMVVYPRARIAHHYDSMERHRLHSGKRWFDLVKLWLRGELATSYDESEWSFSDKHSPQQDNGSDCGVFAVTTAKMLVLGADVMGYGPADIRTQRKRIVAELIHGDFL